METAGQRSTVAEMITIAREFAAEQIDPNAAAWERERRLPRETFTAAAARGLCGLLVPAHLGGAQLTVSQMAKVLEQLAYADMAFAFALVPHNNLAGAIAREGSEYDRARYLDALLDGSVLGAFLLTEPGAGSDASALSTTAIAHGDSWLLNGEKTWVTNATEANVLRVYAQTEPGSGSRGIGAFLVRADQPGVVREEAYEMLGAHASGTGGFRFHDVELEASQLFSPPGEAFRRAMDAIGLARVVVAAMCVGLLRRGLETAVRYVKNRKAFGAPLSDRQGLRWLLADVATDIEAANGLTQAASAALDTGAPDAIVRTAHAKKFAARVAMDGLAQCMQALGANGFRHDQPLARHLAGAKMAHYVDGTTEVQNIVISRALFDSPA